MNKLGIGVMALAAVALSSPLATAGVKYEYPTYFDIRSDGSGEFRGTFGSARYTSNTVEYLGCKVLVRSDYTSLFCYARHQDGRMASCTSTEPRMIAAASALTDGAWVHLGVNAQGVCTFFDVAVGSYHRPPTP